MPFRGLFLRTRSSLTPTTPLRYSLFLDLHLLKRTQAAEQLMRFSLSPIAMTPGSFPSLIVNPYDTPSLLPGVQRLRCCTPSSGMACLLLTKVRQSLGCSPCVHADFTPTTLLRYVRLPLFSGDYCMVTSGQRQRTSVALHGQRLRFRPCTPLISYPIPHPSGILGHNGCADVLRMLAGCGLHKERQSLVFVLAFTQFSFSHRPIKVRLYSCPPYGTCQSAHRLTDRQEPGKKGTHTQSASCSDTELRLCLNNLYLPPDTRIE